MGIDGTSILRIGDGIDTWTKASLVYTFDDLDAVPFAHWSTLDLEEGAVASWIDRINEYDAAESTNRPVLTGRWLDFDGTDDKLTVADITGLPSTNDPYEIWMRVNQKRLASSAAVNTLFAFGGNTNATAINVRRAVISDVNRLQSTTIGGNSNNLNIEFTGIHTIRVVGTSIGHRSEIDGFRSFSNNANPPTIGVERLRFGSNTANTATNFAQFSVAEALIMPALSPTDAIKMYNILNQIV